MDNLPLKPIQVAIFAKLKDAVTINGVKVQVIDRLVNESDAKPIIVFGDQSLEWQGDKESDAYLAEIEVTALAEMAGRAQVKAVMEQVMALLHREPLDVAGWSVIDGPIATDGIFGTSQEKKVTVGSITFAVMVEAA